MSDVMTPDPPDSPDTKPDRQGLFEIASEQGGYFTAHQARARGYSFALLSHHARSGRFIRVRRGLYRLREYPSSPREDLLAAWLAVGKDVAVVSHESALVLPAGLGGGGSLELMEVWAVKEGAPVVAGAPLW